MDADGPHLHDLDDAGREQLLHRPVHLPGHWRPHAHRRIPRLLRRLQGVPVSAGFGEYFCVLNYRHSPAN